MGKREAKQKRRELIEAAAARAAAEKLDRAENNPLAKLIAEEAGKMDAEKLKEEIGAARPPLAEEPKPPMQTAVEQAPQTPPPLPAPTKRNLRGRSTVEGPTKLVWEIADQLTTMAEAQGKTVQRKDIYAACVSAGITHWTARTQIQLWSAAHKADPKSTIEEPKAAQG